MIQIRKASSKDDPKTTKPTAPWWSYRAAIPSRRATIRQRKRGFAAIARSNRKAARKAEAAEAREEAREQSRLLREYEKALGQRWSENATTRRLVADHVRCDYENIPPLTPAQVIEALNIAEVIA